MNRWLLVGIGVVVGLTVGIGVSLATDVPLAPEIGALVGGGIGFALGSVVSRRR